MRRPKRRDKQDSLDPRFSLCIGGININHKEMKYKTNLASTIALSFTILFSVNAIAQKKPTVMILPSDNWCTQRYFTTTYDNQGVKEHIPNYQQAFQEDIELGTVISKIGELLNKMGYSLKDAEQEIKNISTKFVNSQQKTPTRYYASRC